jgi:uncharacterized protein YoxC
MGRFPWIALAAAVVAMAFLVFPLVYAQQHLKAVRNELGRTNEQVVKLEKVVGGLKTEVDEATDIQGKLDEANSTIEQLRKELATSQSQLKEKDADD